MVRRLLAVALALVGAVVAAGPAQAAPCAVNCYKYWADVSITQAWTTPYLWPVYPGTMHSYTARVTNTGWRTGGNTAPTPWPGGPASGKVFVGFNNGIPGSETPIRGQTDSGPPPGGGWQGGTVAGSLAWECRSIPADTTYQLTAFFYAPMAPGTYTERIWLYTPNWTDYDPANNEVIVTYQVGYFFPEL
jgi:hypothetical protein